MNVNMNALDCGDTLTATQMLSINDIRRQITLLNYNLCRKSDGTHSIQLLEKMVHNLFEDIRFYLRGFGTGGLWVEGDLMDVGLGAGGGDGNGVGGLRIEHKSIIACLCVFYKLTLFIRDPIYGKGERDLAYMLVYSWYKYYPLLAITLVKDFVGVRGRKHSHVYGSWKDIKRLCEYAHQRSTGSNISTSFIHSCMDILLENVETHPEIKKWVPREKSIHGWQFEILANKWALKHKPYLFRVTPPAGAVGRGGDVMGGCGGSGVAGSMENIIASQWKQENKLKTANHCRKLFRQYLKGSGVRMEDEAVMGTRMPVNHKMEKSVADFVKEAAFLLRKTADLYPTAENKEAMALDKSWNTFCNASESLHYTIPIIDISNVLDYDNIDYLYSAIGVALFIAHRSSVKNKIVVLYQSVPYSVNIDHLGFFKSVGMLLDYAKGSNHDKYHKGGFVTAVTMNPYPIVFGIGMVMEAVNATGMSIASRENMNIVVINDWDYVVSGGGSRGNGLWGGLGDGGWGVGVGDLPHEKIVNMIWRQSGFTIPSILGYQMPFIVPNIIYWNVSNHGLSDLPMQLRTKKVSVMSGTTRGALEWLMHMEMSNLDAMTMTEYILKNGRYSQADLLFDGL